MKLEALSALQDNYIWALSDNGFAAVVDPGEAGPVLDWLQRGDLQLSAILVTHHHWDHTNGIAELLERHDVPVVGPALEQAPIVGLSVALSDGDRYRIESLGLEFEALHVPGHTLGATTLYCREYGDTGLAFTGDTLFMAGCGRLFEGTAEMMHASLQRLAALPASTLVCCGHEYSLSNLSFAAAVEPGNQALARERARIQQLRDTGRPSLPSTIDLERDINPFLRCDQPGVVDSATRHAGRPANTAVEVFAALREWKDGFRAA